MLKPCWVTFRFLGFQSVRGDICELEKRDSSSTVIFCKMNIQEVLHFTYKVCRQGFLAVATIHMLEIHTKIINDTVSKCYAI